MRLGIFKMYAVIRADIPHVFFVRRSIFATEV